jgi:eight-cysteine-cluster-containing protein
MSSNSRAVAARFAVVWLIFGGAFGCARSAPVISAGAATPLSERSDDPYARLEDRTVVPAYEFGACERDIDCAPRGCGGAVCSPEDVPAVCMTGPVAECFSEVQPSACGCVDGACRWARTAPVMQCAVVGGDRPTNRPFRGVDPPEMYPIRHD